MGGVGMKPKPLLSIEVSSLVRVQEDKFTQWLLFSSIVVSVKMCLVNIYRPSTGFSVVKIGLPNYRPSTCFGVVKTGFSNLYRPSTGLLAAKSVLPN